MRHIYPVLVYLVGVSAISIVLILLVKKYAPSIIALMIGTISGCVRGGVVSPTEWRLKRCWIFYE